MAVEPRTSGSSQPSGPNLATSVNAPALTAEPGSPQSQTLEASPAAAPSPAVSVSSKALDQAPGLPISDGNSTSPAGAVAAPATSSRATTAADPVDGLVAPVAASNATTTATKNQVIELETVSSPPPVETTAQPVNPGGAPHQESAEAVPAASASSETVVPSASSNTTSGATPTSSGAGDDLPPLPGDLGRPVPDAKVTEAPKEQPTPAEVAPAPQPADDVLPQLPAEANRTMSAAPESRLPTQATPVPTSGSPSQPTDVAEQPAQSGEGNAGQPASEPLPVLPAGLDTQPVKAPAERQNTAVMAPAVSPLGVPPADSTSPAITAEPRSTEIAQPAMNVSPAEVPTANPSYPTTNPNLEPQPATTATTGVQTEPDVSSLPPALTDRKLRHLYIGLPVAALIWLRGQDRETALWLLLVVWATDSFAYGAGRLIGGWRLDAKRESEKDLGRS